MSFFLIEDEFGARRRIYQEGCVRCGKPTANGLDFCTGHAYMVGSDDVALRNKLTTEQNKPKGFLNWLKGGGK